MFVCVYVFEGVCVKGAIREVEELWKERMVEHMRKESRRVN